MGISLICYLLRNYFFVTEVVRINANFGRTRATLKRPGRFLKAVRQLLNLCNSVTCKKWRSHFLYNAERYFAKKTRILGVR